MRPSLSSEPAPPEPEPTLTVAGLLQAQRAIEDQLLATHVTPAQRRLINSLRRQRHELWGLLGFTQV